VADVHRRDVGTVSRILPRITPSSAPFRTLSTTGRVLYFTILVPHILLAALMVPFIIAALYQAARGRFDRHARLTRWVWPVWMFVSVSGVTIYWLLYHHADAVAATVAG
jgi:uncharacterized membrane protein YozB (DUF420 family)